MKILAPITLTNASLCGFNFAERLSIDLNAELTVLNVIPSGIQSENQKKGRIVERDLRIRKLKKLTRDYPDLCDIKKLQHLNIKYQVDFGKIVDCILECAKNENIDLIVIGTKPKHSAIEYVFGSISTELMRKCSKPVIVVPNATPYKRIKNIACAVDTEKLNSTSLSYLKKFAERLKAEINFVHVEKIEIEKDSGSTKEKFIERQVEMGSSTKIAVIKNESVVKGLDHFISTHDTNLLALNIPKHTKAYEIFRGSLSKSLVFKSKIPLLFFH